MKYKVKLLISFLLICFIISGCGGDNGPVDSVINPVSETVVESGNKLTVELKVPEELLRKPEGITESLIQWPIFKHVTVNVVDLYGNYDRTIGYTVDPSEPDPNTTVKFTFNDVTDGLHIVTVKAYGSGGTDFQIGGCVKYATVESGKETIVEAILGISIYIGVGGSTTPTFVPKHYTIESGDTVYWHNYDIVDRTITIYDPSGGLVVSGTVPSYGSWSWDSGGSGLYSYELDGGLISGTIFIIASYTTDAIWVDAAVDPTGDGTWGNPFQTIKEAVIAAGTGDSIYIRPTGTYSDFINNQNMKSGINLYGILGEDGTPIATISKGSTDKKFININSKNNIEIFGLKFTGTSSQNEFILIQNNSSDISITRCSFQYIDSILRPLRIVNSGPVIISDVYFGSNECEQAGAISINQPSSVRIEKSTFEGNHATGLNNSYAGAIRISGSELDVTIDHCHFSRNENPGYTKSWILSCIGKTGTPKTISISHCNLLDPPGSAPAWPIGGLLFAKKQQKNLAGKCHYRMVRDVV